MITNKFWCEYLCIVKVLKKFQHIILGADDMKINYLLTALVYGPRQNAAWYYRKHPCREDKHFEISFEFKWKLPATKMSSEKYINFLKKLLITSWKSIFYVSTVKIYCTYISEGFNYRFFGYLFKRYFKNGYFATSISNYL